jgi:hypothetical protein
MRCTSCWRNALSIDAPAMMRRLREERDAGNGNLRPARVVVERPPSVGWTASASRPDRRQVGRTRRRCPQRGEALSGEIERASRLLHAPTLRLSASPATIRWISEQVAKIRRWRACCVHGLNPHEQMAGAALGGHTGPPRRQICAPTERLLAPLFVLGAADTSRGSPAASPTSSWKRSRRS